MFLARFSGFVAVAALAFGSAVLAQDAAGGQNSFQRWCLPCHSAGEGATIKLGPPLNGLDGRPAGTWNGYSYSDAMKNSGITWGEAVFKEYVAAPLQKVPGTRMAFTGVKDPKEVNDLWAYLSGFDKDGNKKYMTKIRISGPNSRLVLLGSRGDSGGMRGGGGSGSSGPPEGGPQGDDFQASDEDVPF